MVRRPRSGRLEPCATRGGAYAIALVIGKPMVTHNHRRRNIPAPNQARPEHKAETTDMTLSFFLAKVFGIYLIVTGVVALLRGKELKPAIDALADSRALVFLTSVFAVILGLLLVIAHSIWIGWPIVITILGWLVLLKALAALLLPFDMTTGLIRRCNTPTWYTVGGLASVLLGIFLAGKGFALF